MKNIWKHFIQLKIQQKWNVENWEMLFSEKYMLILNLRGNKGMEKCNATKHLVEHFTTH